ncbi:hypothetical protein ACLI4Z_00915 [Natrialbaceae archaeon A-arb3/5]
MTRTTDTETDDQRTMDAVSHTNPYTGETAGRLFSRGSTVVADGGHSAATDSIGADEESSRTMTGVDHTPPTDTDDINRVFERGRATGGDDV